MFDNYGAGLLDGMFIQAADQRYTEKETENRLIAEQLRAFRLALKLMQDGNQDAIEACLEHPEDIEFYCDLHDIDL